MPQQSLKSEILLRSPQITSPLGLSTLRYTASKQYLMHVTSAVLDFESWFWKKTPLSTTEIFGTWPSHKSELISPVVINELNLN